MSALVAPTIEFPEDTETSAPQAGEARSSGDVWRLIFRVFLENRLAVAGLAIVVFMVLFSFVGPLIYHTNQIATNYGAIEDAPSASHLLGTDQLGHDVLGRLMVGGQSSLEVGLAAAVLASVIGIVYGAISGFAGGWLDGLMMRILDSLLALPSLLILLIIASIVTPTIPIMIAVIAVISWLVPARLVRGETLAVRGHPYVEAARVAGARSRWIVIRHVMPNVIGVVIVQTTLAVADSILLLAALGYLGLGPPPPATNWGQMLSDGLSYLLDGYWWLVYPAGICIVLTVLAFNAVGDALRDALDVRLQQR